MTQLVLIYNIGNSLNFRDSHGKNYGPFLRMSSDYDLINFKTINFPAGQAPPFSAVSKNQITGIRLFRRSSLKSSQFKMSAFIIVLVGKDQSSLKG